MRGREPDHVAVAVDTLLHVVRQIEELERLHLVAVELIAECERVVAAHDDGIFAPICQRSARGGDRAVAVRAVDDRSRRSRGVDLEVDDVGTVVGRVVARRPGIERVAERGAIVGAARSRLDRHAATRFDTRILAD